MMCPRVRLALVVCVGFTGCDADVVADSDADVDADVDVDVTPRALVRFDQGPPLIEARDHHITFVIEHDGVGFLYVLGGIQNNTRPVIEIERAQIAEDGTLGPFAIVATLPTWTAGGPVVVHGSRVFLFSGLRQVAGRAQHTPAVDIADVSTNGSMTWSAGPQMAHARGHGGAVLVGDRIYVVGGLDDTFVNNANVQSAAVVDDGLSAFRPEADLPLPLSHFSLVAEGGRLLLTGGLSGDSRTAPPRTEILTSRIGADGTLEAWTTDPQQLSVARSVHASVVIDGQLHLIGGLAGVDTELAGVEVANVIDGVGDFRIGPDGFARAHVHQAPQFGERIYLVGGVTFGANAVHESHAESFIGVLE
jgi:hypothetical protein